MRCLTNPHLLYRCLSLRLSLIRTLLFILLLLRLLTLLITTLLGGGLVKNLIMCSIAAGGISKINIMLDHLLKSVIRFIT